MKFFTDEEFKQIYDEVVNEDCYDTLATVAYRVLKVLVGSWCFKDPMLYRRQYEDDIIQLIQIRVYKTCVHGFFKRNGEDNYDPVGFRKWFYTVSLNVFRDFAKKVRDKMLKETDETNLDILPPVSDVYDYAACERLDRAFNIVITSSHGAYKTLTWMAQFLIVANFDVTKIESNDMIHQKFHDMTLDGMLSYVIALARRIPWLTLDAQKIAEFRDRLDKPFEDGERIGNKLYESFYMKKGPKATISDWVNRINEYIVKEEEKNGTSRS